MRSYYFLDANRQTRGPVNGNALASEGVTKDTLVFATSGMTEWKAAGDVPELRALLDAAQPAAATAPASTVSSNGNVWYDDADGDFVDASGSPVVDGTPKDTRFGNGRPVTAQPKAYTQPKEYQDNDVQPSGDGDVENSWEDSVRPSNNLGLAIAAIILFFPLGISALVRACKVNKRWEAGNHAEAWMLSRTSRTRSIICLCVGIPFNILYFILMAAG